MTTKLWLWVMGRMPNKVLYWAVIQAWSRANGAYPDKTPYEINLSMVYDYLKGPKITQYTELLRQARDFKRKHAKDAVFQDHAKKLENMFTAVEETENDNQD